MRLVILDPNLVDTHGHHALYDRVIAAEAGRRDCKTVIIANRLFSHGTLDNIPVHPLLETTCYRQFSDDPVFGAFDDVQQGNRAVFDEMSTLPADFFRRDDLVVVHTVSQITLMGLVTWIATLPAASCPRFCIFLMLPSGISFGPDGDISMDDPAAATAYREAFHRVREADLDVVFFASGAQHARQFSALSKQDIRSHALLTGFDETPAQRTVSETRVLLFVGDAKMNKGLGMLPDLVANVCPAHPGHEFIIHANPGPAWGKALEVVEELRRIAPEHANLNLQLGPLQPQDYADLLAGAAVVLLPYDPQEYQHKSSGVAWEAIASNSHLVVPENTWLDAECVHWGAAHETYGADGVMAALDRAIHGFDAARDRAEQAAQRFNTGNGIKALFDQLADCWVARGAGHTPRIGQTNRVTARDFGSDGWHMLEEVDGTPVRWSAATATLHHVLPGLGDWILTLKGPFHFSTDQLQGARMLVDGVEHPTRFSATENGAWSLSCLFAETQPDMPERTITLQVNHTQTNDDDPRELGLLTELLTLTEDISQPDWTSTELLPAADQTPPDETGWSGPLINGSWSGVLHAAGDCVIGFSVEGRLSPEAIAQMQIFASGQPVKPRLYRDEDWQAQIHLPSAATQGRINLDIILPEPARIRIQPLVWTRTPPCAAPAPGHTHTTETDSEETTEQPQGDPSGPAPEPDHTRPAPVTAPITPEYDLSHSAHWSCDAQETRDTMSFITLSIRDFRAGARTLDDFQVTIRRGETYIALELRELDGAFQLLEHPAPDQIRRDERGAVIRLFANHNGTRIGTHPDNVAASIDGLMALIDALPAGVGNCNLPGEIAKNWLAAATALNRALSST